MTWTNERREAYRRERIAADPDYAAKHREKRKRIEANRKVKIAADPDYAAKLRQQARKRGQKRDAKYRAHRMEAPFDGCDGEGVRRKDGSSDYVLLRLGKRLLFKRGKRLTTPECLDWICSHPHDRICAGFAFEYDISNILRDVATMPPPKNGEPTRLERILAIEQSGAPPGRRVPFWTWLDFDGYGTFGVNYLPRNHLKVCRATRDPKTGRMVSDKKTIRTIIDTFGNFQRSFVAALRDRGVGLDLLPEIQKMKDARSSFDKMTRDHRRYNKIECELLARMMDRFRLDVASAGAVMDMPPRLNGAGKLAGAMHKKNATIKKLDVERSTPAAVLVLAHAAYYGGRFEVTRAGLICEPVYAHDINSAYPAAMSKLPCLKHGRWRKRSGAELAALPGSAIYVCPVRFEHSREQFLCGLPFRDKRSRLSWPRLGNGVYWSPEIRSAQRLGATIEHRAGYSYEPACSCDPLDWVSNAYALRLKLGKDGAGYAIKLGINALYGKFAQRIGEPPYQNPIYAGLVTARTRAAINDAIRVAGPANVAMIATDAIFTVGKPALLAQSETALGKWTIKEYPQGIFIVRPGLYWTASKIKSRGISVRFLRDAIPAFETAWKDYAKDEPDAFMRPAPIVIVNVDVFVGLRLAYRRGDLKQACQWQSVDRKQSFDWGDKRAPGGTWQGGVKSSSFASARTHIVLDPLMGSSSAVSHAYAPPKDYDALGLPDGAEEWQRERMLFEAMPNADEYLSPLTQT